MRYQDKGKAVMRTRKIVLCGLLTALAIVLSYIDHLIPLSVSVPGVKIGLANIAIVFVLYKLGGRDACIVSLVRIIVVGFTFGSVFGMIYSMSGAVLSLAVMLLLYHLNCFSPIGVSVAGGVSHNVGQIIAAICIMETKGLVYYLPVLCISGILAGICVGVVAGILTKRIKKI